jgi:branched-chain amino acid transport system ATP-binding protein
MPMPMSLLEISELRVAYGGVEVLHGLDLRVDHGQMVGLLGPNGAGKTTAIRAIAGLAPPRAGQILLEGQNLIGQAPEEIARQGIAVVPEGRQVFRTLTVRDNLRLARPSSSEHRDRVLERFPILTKRLNQLAESLSGGEQQQLVIARALLASPRLLILDEPSFGLAPKLIDSVYELLAELKADGLTMLLVEQSVDRAIACSDHCTVLGAGRIKAQGSEAELKENHAVVNAYLGPVGANA